MAHVLIVRMKARDGEQDRAAELIEELTAASRTEQGNVHYIPHRDLEDPRVFVLYEQYADEEAFRAHGQTEHFKTIAVEQLFPLASPDDFSDSRHEQIHCSHSLSVIVHTHVERFDFLGIIDDRARTLKVLLG